MTRGMLTLLKQSLKSVIPESYRKTLRRWGTQAVHFGWSRHCPVCNCRASSFRPHGDPPEPDAVCHVCLSKAPHRLAGLFFRNFADKLFQRNETCVHVAPEPELSRQLRRQCHVAGMNYRVGGFGTNYAEFFDLTNLSLPNQSVSLFYCCHVLNALIEDRKAISEILRVLKPEGVAVIQVPAFCTEPTTVEALESEDERIQKFHDPAIYRCYTDADYRSRLQAAGFHVEVFDAASFPEDERIRMGLHGEVLHIGFRNAEHPVAAALRALRQ